jgi:hypothetical protein
VRRKAERLHMWPVGPRLRNMMQQPILRKAMRAQFDRKQNPLETIASVYEVSLTTQPYQLSGHDHGMKTILTRLR